MQMDPLMLTTKSSSWIEQPWAKFIIRCSKNRALGYGLYRKRHLIHAGVANAVSCMNGMLDAASDGSEGSACHLKAE
eukprot:695080-Amphidinium_carterae.1